MPRQEKKLKKFIKITPKKKEEIKIHGLGRNIISERPLDRQIFLNNLTDAISIGSIRIKELENTFFVLDLNENYYSDNSKKTK